MRIAHPVRVLASVSVLVGGLVVGAPHTAMAEEAYGVVFVDEATQLVSFTAAPGQVNTVEIGQIFVTLEGGVEATQFYVYDRVRVEPGPGCVRGTDGEGNALCTLPNPQHPYLRVRLGDKNDRAYVSVKLGTGRVEGGPGIDRIVGATGALELFGGDGPDTLTGGGSDPQIVVGPVVAHGGAGRDVISGAVVAYGDADNDLITGTTKGDVLRGGTGADVIRGNQGNDKIYGNSGNDKLYGNSGNDTISGGPGTDTLSGGPGNDTVKQ